MLKQMNVRYINIKEFHLQLDCALDQTEIGAEKESSNAGFIIEGGGNVSFAKDDVGGHPA